MEYSSKKQLFTIVLIVFLGFLGISLPYLIFPALFLNPAYSIVPPHWSQASHALLLGVTLAAYPLGQFIGSPILGSLSDDYGRKRLISASLIVASLFNLLTGLALLWQNLGLVIFSRLAAGMMEGNIAIARAMATDIQSISKHEALGKINAAASIAYFIGPLLGGLLADNKLFPTVTISTPFYLISLLFIGLSILSACILQERTPIAKNQEIKERRTVWMRLNLIKRLSTLFKNKQLRFLLIVSTLFTLAIDIYYEFGPIYLTTKWMLSPIQLIPYNSVLCIALAIGNGWLAAFSSTRYSSRHMILGSIGGFALLLIGTVLTDNSLHMMFLFCLSGLAIGLGVTLLTVKISNSVSDTLQGEVFGVQISLRVLGDAIICLLGGILLLVSSKLILLFAALISAATMIYYGKKMHS